MLLIDNISEIYTGGSSSPAYRGGYILLEEDIITAIGSTDSQDYIKYKENDTIESYSADNMIALPGLINTHCHAGMSILRGYADDMELMSWLQDKIWPFESRMGDEDIYWGTMLAIAEMLQNGITTFHDMYFAVERIAGAVEETGIRAVIGLGLIEASDGEEGLQQTRNFINNYQNTAEGRITTNIAPHSPYTCSRDYLLKIIDLAVQLNSFIHIHVAETAGEVENIKADSGISPVEYLDETGLFQIPVLAAHCVHLEPSDITLLAENNVSVSHNPASNMKLGSGIAPISSMLESGVNISLGTDGAASNNALDLIQDARLASYLQKAINHDPRKLDLYQILQLVTVNGARALGLTKTGQLKEGYQADIILVDSSSSPNFYPGFNHLSNLFYAGSGEDVKTVFVAGDKLVENNKLLTIDLERVYHEVEKRADRLA